MARNKVCFDSTFVEIIIIVGLYWNFNIFNQRDNVDHISRNLFHTLMLFDTKTMTWRI